MSDGCYEFICILRLYLHVVKLNDSVTNGWIDDLAVGQIDQRNKAHTVEYRKTILFWNQNYFE